MAYDWHIGILAIIKRQMKTLSVYKRENFGILTTRTLEIRFILKINFSSPNYLCFRSHEPSFGSANRNSVQLTENFGAQYEPELIFLSARFNDGSVHFKIRVERQQALDRSPSPTDQIPNPRG